MMTQEPSEIVRYANLFRHLSNPGAYLACKLGWSKRDPLEIRFRNGLRLRVPRIRMAEFKSIVMDDCYFRGFTGGAFRADRPLTIVDVGANIGFFSVYAMSRFPRSRVIAIEPMERNWSFLRGNLGLNPAAAFFPRQCALAARKGVLRLGLDVLLDEDFPTGATVIPPDHEKVSFEVPAIALADLISDGGVPVVHLLKMDCEGAEYEVLDAVSPAVLGRVEHIAMEVHRGRAPGEDIRFLRRRLEGHGYACSEDPNGQFLWAARNPDHLRRG